ncbi:MAG TPA: glycosyltransferase [Candidatus Gordonibacter avicola]|nr:glycosyltransferase [Candidatus Gordonibacter avicola]
MVMGLFARKKPLAPGELAVSVLVPVYNVERFLPACLDSLKAQTLQEIEFICINDGSTDGSLDILRSYAEADERFRIVDKPNSGYGASMNRGLDAARGRYLGIVESDDFASPEMFEQLYKFASRHDLDLVKSNYFEFCDGKDAPQEPFAGFPYKKVFDPREMQAVVKVLPIIWTALYRRQMLVDEGIRFNETPGASFQDTSFVQRVWFAARRVALLKPAYLHYRVDNAGSSVKSAAKVFEVCGEYATSEAFLREDPERFATFAPLLNAMKLDTYRWNYNRIAVECRLEFVRRWAEEFKQAEAEGMLRHESFNDYDWGIAQELMADPDAFFEKYKEAL